jgi:hypothetical protein
MIAPRSPWERLNAYVDGELGPRETADVAREVADDAAVAAQVAAISALKAAAAESVEMPDVTIPEAPAAPKRRSVAWVAAAACAIVVGGLLMVQNARDVAPLELRVARDMHAQWIRQKDPRVEAEPARMLETNLTHLGLMVHAPDLSSVNLFFAHIRPIPEQDGRGLHIGYLGRRGCMLSLVVIETEDALPPGLHAIGDDHEEKGQDKGFTWHVDRYRYVLLAARMDPLRLARVAAVVERLTRDHAVLSGSDRLALQRSREQARPCSA